MRRVAQSVVRSRLRADQAVRPPAEVNPVWQEPAVGPVDFLTQRDLFFDARFDDEQVDKHGPTVASRRRVYSDDKRDTTARWHKGLFSQVKFDALDNPETRVAHHWRYIDRQSVPAPTESDLTAAFSRTLGRAAVINAKIPRLCGAKGRACRAYQGAAVIGSCYRYGLRISAMDMIYTSRVIEAISEHLRRDGRIDWTARTAILDRLEGASDRAVAEKFGLHRKSLQERYDAETVAIEVKFGRYCSEIWQLRQKRPTPCYNSNKNRKSAPPTDRQLSPTERADEVADHLVKANSQKTLSHRSPGVVAQRRLSQHRRVSHGGRILSCGTAFGVASGLYDPRSNKRVLRTRK